MTSMAGTSPPKQVCRLCYYETADTTDVFCEKGIEFDYEGKITKYLYLHVRQCHFVSSARVLNHFVSRSTQWTIYRKQFVGCVRNNWARSTNFMKR